MALVGEYDPAGYDPANPATWPQPPTPPGLYQPGMFWQSTGTGTVAGQPVKPDDLLYVIARDRLYGEWLYGDGLYGGPLPTGDWTAAEVSFLVWVSGLPPNQTVPFPYSGCEFDPIHHPGWWVVIDGYFADAGRRYGEDLYGAGDYGGDAGAAGWHDVTSGFTSAQIDAGTGDGTDVVDATEVQITWHDPDGTLVDPTPPGSWHTPTVGTPLRVGFFDPVWKYWPRAVVEVEAVRETVDAGPRFVTVDAVAPIADFGVTLFGWQRAAEKASARFAALLAAGGWRYGLGTLVYPPDADLHADQAARDVIARAEMDRTARSAGWQFDTDLWGSLRLRSWPLEPAGPPVAVVDCAGHGVDGRLAVAFTFTADESQLVNVAQVSNSQTPEVTATATDETSRALYGNRSALGFPKTGLAFATAAAGQALADRARNRYSRTVLHVDPIEADTYVDRDWLAVLAALDTGQAVTVTRVHPDPPYTLAGNVVVGYTETITPGRVETTIHTTTTTPTL